MVTYMEKAGLINIIIFMICLTIGLILIIYKPYHATKKEYKQIYENIIMQDNHELLGYNRVTKDLIYTDTDFTLRRIEFVNKYNKIKIVYLDNNQVIAIKDKEN